jgi:hypothetical protein
VIEVRFAPEIAGELGEAASWYERKQVGLGASFSTTSRLRCH